MALTSPAGVSTFETIFSSSGWGVAARRCRRSCQWRGVGGANPTRKPYGRRDEAEQSASSSRGVPARNPRLLLKRINMRAGRRPGV